MPYKNKNKQKQAQKSWYLNNKKEIYRRVRERKIKLIEFVRNYKQQDDIVCVDCGEGRWQCLHFDHINRSEKTDSISQMARRGVAIERLLVEMEKCDVVCANCHAIRHDGFVWESVSVKINKEINK